MCQPVTCRVCGKTTWAGCGQHVAQVKRSVASSQWCKGEHSRSEIEAARAQRSGGGFLARLFGR